MANPYDCEHDATDGNVPHESEADGQQCCDRHEDGEFGFQGHRALGDVAFKHLLVEFRAFEPGVQAL